MEGDTGSHRDTHQQRRPHSNTVSGDRPPAIDTTLARNGSPSAARRNSEGSPRLPPPINISEPTPVDPMDSSPTTLSLQKHFPDNQVSSRASSPTPTPIAAPEQQHLPVTSSSTSAVSRLLRKPRSRASSLSTTGSVNNDEAASDKSLPKPTNNIGSSKLRNGAAAAAAAAAPRRASELTVDTRASSERTPSMAAGSIAAACNLEVASAKRNQDFHALFRSVPEEDPLIEDFGCALQKEILLQGRIYISENHLCFNANIFGWVTNLVIAFKDIVDIEKKTTALFIPNAIQVSTLHAKHFFASFLSRDQAYDLIVDVWRCSRSKENGDNRDSRNSQSNSTDNDDYGSDLSDASSGSYVYTDDDDASSIGAGDAASDSEEPRERQVSLASLPLPKVSKDEEQDAARRRAISEAGPRPNMTSLSKDDANGNAAAANGDAAVQQTKEKTECACGKNGEHFPKVVLDQTFDCTIENLYNLLYFSDFTKKFLVEQKNTEVTISDWRKGDGNVLKTRDMSYIKPLNGSIGPKQTKCLLTEELLYVDLDDYVTQLTTTQTPDVPSGSSFLVKTRVCLMWAGKGQVRMLVTVLVEFSKSSWLKSTIENASINGQESYYKDLDAAIRRYLSSQGGDRKKADKRKKVKRKRRHRDKEDKSKQKEKKEPSGVLQIVVDKANWIISNISIPSAEQMTALLMLLLVFSNIFIASKMAQVDRQLQALSDKYKTPSGGSSYSAPMRSELRTDDENELWEWLGRIDPDIKAANIAEPVQSAADWDNKLEESQLAKKKLDEHMADLEKMIQRASANMEQVTRVVDQQRQRILSEWSSA